MPSYCCPICGRELEIDTPSVEEVLVSCRDEGIHRKQTLAPLDWKLYQLVTETISADLDVRQWAYEKVRGI